MLIPSHSQSPNLTLTRRIQVLSFGILPSDVSVSLIFSRQLRSTIEDLKNATQKRGSFVKGTYPTIERVCSWTSALVDINQIPPAPITYANNSPSEMGLVVGRGKPYWTPAEG